MRMKGIAYLAASVAAIFCLAGAEDVTSQTSNLATNSLHGERTEAAVVSKAEYVEIEGTITCPPGFYPRGRSECVECPSGQWSSGGSKSCKSCSAGQMTNDHLSCTDCPAGEYSKKSSNECKKCGEGKISKSGASTCTACVAGHYADHILNECVPCPAGTTSKSKSDVCKPCSVGQYSPSGSDRCVNCLPSYYSSDPAQPCMKCPSDQYSTAKASKCLSCSAGSTVNSSQTGCKRVREPTPAPTSAPTLTCGPGTYPECGPNPSICVPCPSGLASPGGLEVCVACAVDERPTEDQSMCEKSSKPLTCKPMYYGVKYGDSSTGFFYKYPCVRCPPGSFSPHPGGYPECATSCEDELSHINFEGTACVRTSPPTSEPTPPPTLPPGPVVPFYCGPGRYPDIFTGKCWPCKYGTYSRGGAAKCTDCPAMHRANEAHTECEQYGPLKCKAGYYGPGGPGSWNYPCVKCPAGKYRSASYSTERCDRCSDGSVPNEDQSGCVVLQTPEPTWEPTHQPTSQPTPEPTLPPGPVVPFYCGPGRYPDIFTGKCWPCKYGTYSRGGAAKCTDCPAMHRANEAHTECEQYGPLKCKAGYYGPGGPGSWNYPCVKCPAGKYRSASYSTERCDRCSDGSVPNEDQSGCVVLQTPEPTWEPTHQPTSQPTPEPTLPPGPVVPFYCGPGRYPDIFTGKCWPCKYGTYSRGGAAKCTDCPAMHRANEAHTECEQYGPLKCKAGYYGPGGPGSWNYPCVKCPAGKYRSASYSTERCDRCSDGSVPNEDQSGCVVLQTPEPTWEPTHQPTSQPTPEPTLPPAPVVPFYCGPGRYPNTRTGTCWPCEYGTYSRGGAAECTDCPAMYRANEDHTGCEGYGPLICKAGYYGPGWAGTWMYPCEKCPAGKYRSASYSTEGCFSCSDGSVPNEDQSGCVALQTPEPTWEPTHQPTSQPTPEPTWEPTHQPTSQPTPEPTWEPTHQPTSQPTPEPTWEPTHQPTSEPTYAPTQPLACGPGTYPEYGPLTSSCVPCPSGLASPGGLEVCVACAVDERPTEDQSMCEKSSKPLTCKPMYYGVKYGDSSTGFFYKYPCVRCPPGSFSPHPGGYPECATSCEDELSHINFEGTACVRTSPPTSEPTPPPTLPPGPVVPFYCGPGRYPDIFTGKCWQCEYGTYSRGGAAKCTDCPAMHRANEAHTECEQYGPLICKAGYYGPGGPGSWNYPCVKCPAGEYRSASYSSERCDRCSDGSVPNEDQSGCVVLQTPEPTWEPTHQPTNQPTPEPTLPPEPVVPFYCGPGEYPNTRTGTCWPCEYGTYSRGGAAKCIGCPAMYRADETRRWCEEYGPLKCKAGYYGPGRPGSWNYPCVKCPAGEYRSADDTDTMECDRCDDGSVPNEDQSGCVVLQTPAPTLHPTFYPLHYDCAPGYYGSLIPNVGCLECPPGTISQGVTTKCEECPGRFTNVERTECVSGPDNATPAPTPPPTLPPGPVVPFYCGPGRYPDIFTGNCRPCEYGTYSRGGAAKCTDCPAMHRANEAHTECEQYGPLICKAGYYGPGGPGSWNYPCVKCPAGEYRSASYSSERCDRCSDGSVPNEDQSGCVVLQTPEPTWEPTHQPTSQPTPEPTLPPEPVVPFYCGPGEYPNTRTGTCWPCEYGTYSRGGAAECIGCPAMYRADETRRWCEEYGPLKCKAGYYGPGGPGSWNYPCVKCPAGEYRSADDTDTMECDRCDDGSVPNEDQSGCVVLQTPAPTLHPTFYPLHYDCAPGYYDSLIPNVGCLECPPGTISQGVTTKCEECPGRFTNVERTECVSGPDNATPAPTPPPTLPPGPVVPFYCGPGRYPDIFTGNCRPCEYGTYSRGGAAKCTDCPAMHRANEAHTECEQYGPLICKAGYYGPGGPGSWNYPCVKCPAGEYRSASYSSERCDRCSDGSVPNEDQSGCVVLQTPEPTWEPTHQPTNQPTPEPTLPPEPVVPFYCGPGEYPNTRTGTCWPCEYGTYSRGGAAECIGCPAMYRADETRRWCEEYGPLKCKAGYYGPGGPGSWNYPCVKCPAGEYRSADDTDTMECDRCDDGSVPNEDQSGCVVLQTPAPTLHPTFYPLHYDCAPGYYDSLIPNVGCLECPPGTISQGVTTKCEECPGRFTNVERTECVSGPDNATPAPTPPPTLPPGPVVPFYCGPGRYPDIFTGNCRPCEYGTYSRGGAAKCTDCPAMHRANEAHTECEQYGPLICKAGYYGPGGPGSWNYPCVKCPAGEYRSASYSSERCDRCSDGSVPNEDQSGCVVLQTPEPTWEPTHQPTNQPTPEPTLPPEPVVPFYCGPGEYPNTRTGTCWPCEYGTYSRGGAAKCIGCPAMYRADETRRWCEEYGPLKCKAGYYGPGGPGSWNYPCVKCPAGEYRSADDTDTMECDRCDDGSVPNEDQSGCVVLQTPAPTLHPTFYPLHYDCAPGYYGSLIPNVGCLECPPGTISQGVTTKCEECPGRFTNVERTECVSGPDNATPAPTPPPTLPPGPVVPFYCGPGRYPDIFTGNCWQCEYGTYSRGGVAKCTDCPAMHRANEAHTECEQYGPLICKAGYYGPGGPGSWNYPCVKCPAGEYRSASYSSERCDRCSDGSVPNEDQSGCVVLQTPEPTWEPTHQPTNQPTPEPTLPPEPVVPFYCGPGEYPNTRTGTCWPCEYGTYSRGGAAKCIGCPAMYRADETRRWCEEYGPLKCKAGYYGPGRPGSWNYPCVKCPAGEYRFASYPNTNSERCFSCSDGSVPNEDQSGCVVLQTPEPTWEPTPAPTTFKYCGPGTYPDCFSACLPCPAGSQSPGGLATCVGCPADSRPKEDRTGCEMLGQLQCKSGYYSKMKNGSYNYPCEKCPKGTFSPGKWGFLTCEKCPAGQPVNSKRSGCITPTTRPSFKSKGGRVA